MNVATFCDPYLVGLVSAPLVTRIVQPLARSAVKTTIELGMQARNLAAEDLQDLVAETSAEMAAAEMKKKPGASVMDQRSVRRFCLLPTRRLQRCCEARYQRWLSPKTKS